MAIVEAMALGLPVLITDKCHMDEVAAAGAGVVIADDVDGIAGGLAQILAPPATDLAAMGEAGRRLVEERYTWAKVATDLEAAYAAALVRK